MGFGFSGRISGERGRDNAIPGKDVDSYVLTFKSLRARQETTALRDWFDEAIV